MHDDIEENEGLAEEDDDSSDVDMSFFENE